MLLAYLNLGKAYFHFSKKAEYYKFSDQEAGLSHSNTWNNFLYFIFLSHFVFEVNEKVLFFLVDLIFQKFDNFFRFLRNHKPLV